MIVKTIEDLQVGDCANFCKTISESDVYLFAGITGDFNPAHINRIYAEKTFFKARIVHGILLAGLLSAVIANQLPGPGTVYIHQDLDFKAPVYIGDTVTARVEVLSIYPNTNRVELKTTCINQNGEMVVVGLATVSPPKRKKH